MISIVNMQAYRVQLFIAPSELCFTTNSQKSIFLSIVLKNSLTLNLNYNFLT